MRLLNASLVAIAALSVAGCWYDSSTSRSPNGTTPATPTPSSPPPRVSIDANRTLHASPGQGVGLFITYSSGGNWKLEWTCDTNVSRSHACRFDIAVGTHGVSGIASVPSNAVVQRDAESLRINTITTTTLDSATFKTEPGGAIALAMRMDGQPFPKLMFFVSDGQLSTAPSDPIELVPSEP
jgi:hypothetical protein